MLQETPNPELPRDPYDGVPLGAEADVPFLYAVLQSLDEESK
jgi:hypothetical protein